MALAVEPALLILDEPTTGLDATVEAEVLDLVAELRRGALDLGAVHQPQPGRDRQDVRPGRRALRRRAGGGGPGGEVFDDPRHPYTVGLLRCIPARRPAQGPGPARHHPRLPARARRRHRPAASSPTAARSPTTAAAPSRRRCIDLRRRRQRRRCHYHEQAPSCRAPHRAMWRPRPRSRSAHPSRCSAPGSEQDLPAVGHRHPRARRRRPRHPRPARRWGWSASPAAARRRSPGCCWASAAGRGTTARARRQAAGRHAPRSAAATRSRRSRSSSRTRTRRSTARHIVRQLVGRSLSSWPACGGKAREDRLVELTRSVRLADRYLADAAARSCPAG